MTIRPALALPALILAALAGCNGNGGKASPHADTSTANADRGRMDELVALMTGSFSSQRQSETDTEYLDIRLHATEIWGEGAVAGIEGLDRAGFETEGMTERRERWIYIEQALSTKLDKPYRQRVYRLTRAADGAYHSTVFTLPGTPLTYANAWSDPTRLAGLTPDQLTEREGCTVTLRRSGDHAWEGGTEGTACASDLLGASYSTSKVTINADAIESWDQGFNASGTQVWGAVTGGYRFDRIGDATLHTPDQQLPADAGSPTDTPPATDSPTTPE